MIRRIENLFEHILVALLLAAQIAFYAVALGGFVLERRGYRLGALALPYYFALANAASLVALVQFLSGTSHAIWDPQRAPAEAGVAEDFA